MSKARAILDLVNTVAEASEVVNEYKVLRLDPHSGEDRAKILQAAEDTGLVIISERDKDGCVVIEVSSDSLAAASFKQHLVKDLSVKFSVSESAEVTNEALGYLAKGTADKFEGKPVRVTKKDSQGLVLKPLQVFYGIVVGHGDDPNKVWILYLEDGIKKESELSLDEYFINVLE